MFDGLIEVLMEFLALAWCWLLDKLIGLAIAMIKLTSMIMPSVAVPSWFTTSLPLTTQVLEFVAFFFPLATVAWLFSATLLYEMAHFIVLVLYRSFMDLL